MRKVLLLLTVCILFTGCKKELPSYEDATPLPEGIEEDAVTANWATYKNDRYDYDIKYPPGWYFLKDACCPPPPAYVSFNNSSDNRDKLAEHQLDEGIHSFDIFCGYEGNIDEIGEVKLQKKEGKKSEETKVNNWEAVKFTSPAGPDANEKVYSYYIVNGKEGCRLIYRSECPVCEAMLSTFSFWE